jgi:hypothetical protein
MGSSQVRYYLKKYRKRAKRGIVPVIGFDIKFGLILAWGRAK